MKYNECSQPLSSSRHVGGERVFQEGSMQVVGGRVEVRYGDILGVGTCRSMLVDVGTCAYTRVCAHVHALGGHVQVVCVHALGVWTCNPGQMRREANMPPRPKGGQTFS